MRVGFTILLFSTFSILLSQNPYFHFKNYLPEDGLPSRECYTLKIDHKGYLWIGTDNGLSRFDGYNFKNYSISQEYEDNVINGILRVGDTLYLSSLYGNIFLFIDEKFIPFKYNHIIQKYKSKFLNTNLLKIDDSGSLIIALNRLGILEIKRDGSHVLHQENNNLHAYFKKFDNFYVGIKNSIAIKNKGSLKVEDINYEINNIRKNIINSNHIFSDEAKQAYDVAIQFNNLYFIKNKSILRSKINFEVSQILEHSKGGYFIGGRFNGLFYAESFEDILQGKLKNVIPDINVSYILEDELGLFVSTIDQGLFYVPNINIKIWKTKGIVSAIVAKNKKVIFGINKDKIYEITDDAMKPVMLNEFNFPYNYEIDIINGDIYTSGIIYNNKYKNKILTDNKLKVLFRKVHHDISKNVVLFNNHLMYGEIDEKSSKITYYNFLDSTKNKILYDIISDNNSRHWLASQIGLYEIRDKRPIKVRGDTLLNKRINCLAPYKDYILLGTRDYGIIGFKDSIIFKFNSSNGLKSNNIKDIKTKDDKLYIGTDLGLSIINTGKNYAIKNITVDHGLPSNEIYTVSIDDNDYIWLATSKGVIKLKDYDINYRSDSPILESFLVNSKKINIDSFFEFNSNQNNITINFKTINFKLCSNIKYRYKINEDTTWTYTYNTSLNFNSLKSRDYIVKISSSNEDGIWSKPLILNFTINKPWFNHWLFYLGILIGLSGIFYLFYKNKMSRLTKETKFRQEINRLEKMALQSQMNPHFLSNSFTAIQNLITSNQNEKADLYLTKLSRLLRKILESSRSSELPLSKEIEILKLYTSLEEIRFDHKFETTFSIDSNIDLDKTYILPMLLQPIVENAINHGLRQINHKGKLTLEFKLDGDYLVCIISDNGIGREASMNSKMDSNKISMSGSIIEERISKHNLANNNQIALQYIDSNKGTTVIIKIEQLKVNLL